MINKSDNSRALLLSYLLGELALDDREEIERKMLTDQEFSDEIQEAEYDLMEDYHHGRLTKDERSRAEAAFGRRQLVRRVRMNRMNRPAGAQGTSAGWGRRLSLVATAMLLVALSGWFAASHLWRKPEQSRSLEQAPSNVPGAGVTSPEVTKHGIASSEKVVLLLSGVSRGVAGDTLRMHDATKDVLVQWVVPRSLRQNRFVLELQRGGETLTTVAQAGPLKSMDGSSIAEFHLPAARFRRGAPSHVLVLIREASGKGAVVEEFPVRVVHARQQ